MNLPIKIFSIGVVLLSMALAAPGNISRQGNNVVGVSVLPGQNNNGIGAEIQGYNVPKTAGGTPGYVERNRVEYKTVENAEAYKDAQVRRYQRERILNEIFDTAILMTPSKRVIRPIDTIGISPLYITQIVFPSNMVITDAQASFAVITFEYNRNLLRIRPDDRSFFAGNIVLSLTDGTRNYAMTIFAERYYQEDCKIENGEYICSKKHGGGKGASGNYAFVYNNLSTFYQYVVPRRIDPMEAIMIYEKLKRKPLEITRDGDRVSFKYDGIYYDIIRDDRRGTVGYRGKMYRVVPRG